MPTVGKERRPSGKVCARCVAMGVTGPPRADTRASRGGSAAAEHDHVTASPCRPAWHAEHLSRWFASSRLRDRSSSTCRRQRTRSRGRRATRRASIASSVPASGRDANASSRRSQSCVRPDCSSRRMPAGFHPEKACLRWCRPPFPLRCWNRRIRSPED